MSVINSSFVIAVHDQILTQTGVGREGCHVEKFEGIRTLISKFIIIR